MDEQNEEFQEPDKTGASERSLTGSKPERDIIINQTPKPDDRKPKRRLYHKSKTWKAYIFDFLMIFLAVTLGFMAENLRERYMENKRVRQYAQSLYEDLKIDTAIIQRTYDEEAWIQLKFDSAAMILASNDLSDNNEFIYYVERYLSINDMFSSQDVTYQQLRSSGNLRYMRNFDLIKGIAEYYNLYTRYLAIDGDFGLIDKNELALIEAKLFNISDLTSLDNHNGKIFYDLVSTPHEKFQPINNDREALNLLHLKITNASTQNAYSKGFLTWLKADATYLIGELKREYKLE